MNLERLLPEYGSFTESQVFLSIPPSEKMVSFSQATSNRNTSEAHFSKKRLLTSRLPVSSRSHTLDSGGLKRILMPQIA